jgi:hypothetical protein
MFVETLKVSVMLRLESQLLKRGICVVWWSLTKMMMEVAPGCGAGTGSEWIEAEDQPPGIHHAPPPGPYLIVPHHAKFED